MKARSAHEVLVELPARFERGEDVGLAAIEDEFFQRIKLRNGTYKTTARCRLADVDAAFLGALAAANSRPCTFLDVAASSGITSVEWLDSLTGAGLAPRMTITDATAFASLVNSFPWFRVLIDQQSNPLEFEVFSRPLRARVKKTDLVSGNVFLILAARSFFCLTRSRSARVALRQRLPLVSHEVKRRPEISVVEDDIIADDGGRMEQMFDAIRAANILQTVYFREPELRRALANLKNRLKGEGSWFIVCRTREGSGNHASIFRLENGRFVVKSRLGTGTEIEHLVLAT